MPNHTSFRLDRRGMLLVLVSAAFAGEAVAATGGRVDFATAGASVAGSDGQQRPLAKGAELGTGDTVRTDTGARAQIRFTDGSYVSLQPNTEFAIKDYNFEGKTDGSESGIFGLAKGAMRTITGLVGRVNRNKYQIVTPTATVGIRGTGGRIEVLNDGSTLIAGTSGIWTLTNPSGTLDVPAGTFGKAPSAPNQPPQQTSQSPNTGPAPLPVDPPKPLEPKGIDKQTDPACQTNSTAAGCINSVISAAPPVTLPPLVSGGSYTAAIAADLYRGSGSGTAFVLPGMNATFDPSGRLTDANIAGAFQATLASGGTHAEFGTDGILAWGRWIGPVSISCVECSGADLSANKGFHYVVGVATPVLPVSGTATYALLGATRPTYTDGSSAPGTFSGSLNVSFAPAGATVGMNLNVSMSDGKGYAIGGTSAVSSGSQFVGAAVNSASTAASSLGTSLGQLTITPTSSTACSSGCFALVQGFFAGTSAERVGLSYSILDSSASANQIIGAAAFKKQ